MCEHANATCTKTVRPLCQGGSHTALYCSPLAITHGAMTLRLALADLDETPNSMGSRLHAQRLRDGPYTMHVWEWVESALHGCWWVGPTIPQARMGGPFSPWSMRRCAR